MKNSKEYSKKLQTLYRALKRKYPKPQTVTYDEPTEAIVYAILTENISVAATQAAMKKFADYFVDSNDLRVSRSEEIVELLAIDATLAKKIASTLTTALRIIFEKNNNICLAPLKKIGKRPARKTLEKIEGASRFVVDYCMLTSLQGHAIPLTQKMIRYLKVEHLVHKESDEQEIGGFLARQVSAKNAYEFYELLRLESDTLKEKPKARPKKKKAKIEKTVKEETKKVKKTKTKKKKK